MIEYQRVQVKECMSLFCREMFWRHNNCGGYSAARCVKVFRGIIIAKFILPAEI